MDGGTEGGKKSVKESDERVGIGRGKERMKMGELWETRRE